MRSPPFDVLERKSYNIGVALRAQHEYACSSSCRRNRFVFALSGTPLQNSLLDLLSNCFVDRYDEHMQPQMSLNHYCGAAKSAFRADEKGASMV